LVNGMTGSDINKNKLIYNRNLIMDQNVMNNTRMLLNKFKQGRGE
jgi:hypothetical protein